MFYRLAVASLISVVCAGASFAQVFVDTFSNAQTTISRNTVGFTILPQADASAIGGTRTVTNSYVSGTNNFDLLFNGTTMQSSANSGVVGNFLLNYGGTGGNQLNANITGNNAFVFDRVFLDLSATVTVTVVSGNGGVTATLSGFALAGGGGPNTTVNLFLSSFTNGGSLNLADIDAVTFQFTAAQQSTQFTLDNLRFANVAVPEPATIALIGLTGVGLAGGTWFRRRKLARQLQSSVR